MGAHVRVCHNLGMWKLGDIIAIGTHPRVVIIICRNVTWVDAVALVFRTRGILLILISLWVVLCPDISAYLLCPIRVHANAHINTRSFHHHVGLPRVLGIYGYIFHWLIAVVGVRIVRISFSVYSAMFLDGPLREIVWIVVNHGWDSLRIGTNI